MYCWYHHYHIIIATMLSIATRRVHMTRSYQVDCCIFFYVSMVDCCIFNNLCIHLLMHQSFLLDFHGAHSTMVFVFFMYDCVMFLNLNIDGGGQYLLFLISSFAKENEDSQKTSLAIATRKIKNILAPNALVLLRILLSPRLIVVSVAL